jgi:histidine triad (HIT) family protein
MTTKCEFCEIVTGCAPATVVAEDKITMAFMDAKPATRGHLLVVPKRHCCDLFDAAPDEWLAVMSLVYKLARACTFALGADGVNVVHATGLAAFQSVYHLHVHVVPRYPGDSVIVFPRPGRAEEIAAAAAAVRHVYTLDDSPR